MKTKREHEVIARIARGSLTLAAVLALVTFGAGAGRAQTPAAKATPAANRPANMNARPGRGRVGLLIAVAERFFW